MRLFDLVGQYLGNVTRKQKQMAIGNSSCNSAPVEENFDLHLHHTIDVLAPSVDDWPLEWRELFEERAAIMEFEGNIPRSEAERAAEAILRKVFRLQQEVKTSQKTNCGSRDKTG